MPEKKAKKPHNDSAKKRIYLSGAITGVPNYKKDFEIIKLDLQSKGYKRIINPAELDEVIINGDYEEYMEICIKLIDMCDLVILIPGWEKSAGANREMGYALGKNIAVTTYEGLVIEQNMSEAE